MQPHRRPRRLPARGAAVAGGIDGQGQAFKAAPAIADAEMDQPVDQRGAGNVIPAIEDEGEKAGRAGKVTRPMGMAGTVGKRGMQDTRDAGLILQPARHRQRAIPVLPQADAERAQPARGEPGVVGTDHLAEEIGGLADLAEPVDIGGHASHHDVAMADNIFGAGEDGDVDAMRHGREIERRRPGIVHQRDDAMRPRPSGDGRHILHLESEAAGAFQEDGADRPAGKLRVQVRRQWIIIDGFDAVLAQHLGTKGPGRIIGAVDHEQPIARFQHRHQRAGDRRHAGREQHSALRPRLHLGDRIRQAPGGRRALAPVKEPFVRAAGGGCAQMRDIVIEDGGGAPDRGTDNAAGLAGHAGPFRLAARLHQLRQGLAPALSLVLAAHAGPVALGVAGSKPHSDQLPS